jgi:hypothetical protein
LIAFSNMGTRSGWASAQVTEHFHGLLLKGWSFLLRLNRFGDALGDRRFPPAKLPAINRLLHRGKYAVEPEGGIINPEPEPVFSLAGIIGIEEHFTRGDRWITIGIFGWNLLWFLS